MENDENVHLQPAKRRRTGRRQAACKTCALKKIACGKERPTCSSCHASGEDCYYTAEPDETFTLERVVDVLSSQISGLAEKLDFLTSDTTHLPQHGRFHHHLELAREISNDRSNLHLPLGASDQGIPESSRDFAHIPPHKTTADEVLTWPIFNGTFPANYLIDYHLGSQLSTGGHFDDDIDLDIEILPVSHDVAPLDEQRIPLLVDQFLENVHTKNPILDVELLVKKSREYAVRGIAWDGTSCLLLICCSLGLVAKPFGSEVDALDPSMSLEAARQISAPARERSQADNCFVQATRRLGGLRPSVLAAQCYFFAGVYLMYTLRPMLSWQYFYQSSITFQLYLRMHGRVLEDNSIIMRKSTDPHSSISKIVRLEQRLFWSTFKSESEFRVELPLPQSEIADFNFPNLFPSPPSPMVEENASNLSPGTSPVAERSNGFSSFEHSEAKAHAKRLCNEEESWYYYLTEVALRRIGNRVINSFFRHDRHEWLNIEQFLDMAMEFEAQVSTWQTNLPPAMQKYEVNSTIRAPRVVSPGGAEAGFVSRELSWATENRLLEMRHWLYQPFLYYLVHAQPAVSPAVQSRHSSFVSASGSPSATSGVHNQVFWSLISRAVECNLMILDTRVVPHRHHGLWFDLRAIICSSLLMLALVKSGYTCLIPGGIDTLVGRTSNIGEAERHSSVENRPSCRKRIEGKLGRVLRQLEIWSHESPDMVRAREMLETLIELIVWPHMKHSSVLSATGQAV